MLRLMSFATAALLLAFAPAIARANAIVSATLEPTCDGFTVTVTAVLGYPFQSFLDYEVVVDPAAPGTPIVRSLPIGGDPASSFVTVSETVAFAQPLTGGFTVSGDVALRFTPSQLAFNGGLPVALDCSPSRPAIELRKEVRLPGSANWFDANDEANAPVALAPSDAEYRLIVVNTGNVELEDVVVNDASLGLVDAFVGDLAAGASLELTRYAPGFAALYAKGRCAEAGTVVNVADVAGRSATSPEEQPVIVTDEDPALLICTEPPGGGEGCTPGYWKQAHHFDSWTSYAPDQSYATVFGVTPSFQKTLLGALKQGGGGEKALGRHAVAALLNAASGGVSYEFSVEEVIAIVRTAYATRNFERAKNELARENERGCPLN